MTRTGVDAAAIGRHVRIMREARSLGRDEAATAAGCTAARLAEIENGRRAPTIEQLHAVALALDTTPGRLIDGPCSPRMLDLSGMDDQSAAALEILHAAALRATT